MAFPRAMSLFLAVLLLFTGSLLAQEATPEATPEATAQAGELTRTLMVEGIGVSLPEGWSAIPGQPGSIVIASIDIYQINPRSGLPPETILIQVSLYNISSLPPEMGPVATARQILEGIPTQQQKPPVTEIQRDGVTLARIDGVSDKGDTVVFAILVDADTFIFATVATLNKGVAAKYEDQIQTILAHLAPDLSAPVSEDILTRYADIPQSVSPEGYPRLGSASAPVKIQVILSFACPACRTFHELAFPLLLERIKAGGVLLEYLPYVLSGNIANNGRATRAALCAGEQGKFWEYHDTLFGWHSFGTTAFLDTRLKQGAAALSLDIAAFNACMQADRMNAVLDTAGSVVQNLRGFVDTPAVLFNGAIIPWAGSGLNAMIDAALAPTSEPTAEVTAEATAEITPEATAEATPEATATP